MLFIILYLKLGVIFIEISDYYFMYIFRNKIGNENKENFFIKYRDIKYIDEYVFF